MKKFSMKWFTEIQMNLVCPDCGYDGWGECNCGKEETGLGIGS